MSAVITFRDVSKSYGGAEAVRDLSLSIEKGEFITVLGASGGGKTTFLKMINGLVEPTSGEITVLGESLKTADLVQLRRKIGYAIQGSVLFPHLTVEENIAYVPNLWNKSDKERTKKAVAKWMAIVGLAAELGERYPAELSGGQQQRVGIARALAASPAAGRDTRHSCARRSHDRLRHARCRRSSAPRHTRPHIEGWLHRAVRRSRGDRGESCDGLRAAACGKSVGENQQGVLSM